MRLHRSCSTFLFHWFAVAAVMASSAGLGMGCAGPRPPGAPPARSYDVRDEAQIAAPPRSERSSSATASAADPELQRLAGSILVGGHAFDYVRDLSDAYGPRLTGSPVLAGAARWAAESFRRAGLRSVRIEEFTIPHGWERREARARMVSPAERPLRVAAVGWSAPTPEAGVRGRVLVLDLEESLRFGANELRGAIVLFSRRAMDREKKVVRTRAIKMLAQAGVAAILFHQQSANHVFRAHSGPLSHELVIPVPLADISLEDGAVLERAVEKGPVTLELVSTSPVLGPVKVPNVVAEIRGSERPDEIVLVGAHLDAWDFGTGSQDNGSGVASVLEAARAIHALGRAPKRTLRFALWGGEEQGLWGSRAYVKAHAGELDRTVMVLNTDLGAGELKGWVADGRPDVSKRLAPLTKPLLSGLGADAFRTDMNCQSDQCSFWLEGVPTLNLDVDTSHYFEVHHQSSDTLDKIAPGALASGAAVVAVTALLVADLPDRVAPRLDHDTVLAHVKENKLLDALQVEELIAE